jgi:hypothetical protein
MRRNVLLIPSGKDLIFSRSLKLKRPVGPGLRPFCLEAFALIRGGKGFVL